MARSALLNVMVQAAFKAGKSLARDFGEVQNLQVSLKGPGDYVSQADRRAEEIIFTELSKARPGYSFVMEERGEVAGEDEPGAFKQWNPNRSRVSDIEDALRATLSKFEHQTGIATTLGMVGHGLPLPSDLQIQVLHMVQEALSNVRKHAQATRVDLVVHRHPRWRFEVQDNGVGFEVVSVPPDSLHVGLGIMRERAQRIGAVVQVESAPGQGTRVCIELPTVSPAPAQVPAIALQEEHTS